MINDTEHAARFFHDESWDTEAFLPVEQLYLSCWHGLIGFVPKKLSPKCSGGRGEPCMRFLFLCLLYMVTRSLTGHSPGYRVVSPTHTCIGVDRTALPSFVLRRPSPHSLGRGLPQAFFLTLLAIWIHFFVKCLFKSFTYYYTGFFTFSYWFGGGYTLVSLQMA